MLGKLTRIMNLTEDEIINHPGLLVNVLDHQHRVLFWNRKCEEFFGIRSEEALGKTLEDLLPETRNNKKMLRLEEALSGKEVFIADDKHDTRHLYYTQIVLPLKNNNGKVVAAVNIVRFIPDTSPFNKQELTVDQHLHSAASNH